MRIGFVGTGEFAHSHAKSLQKIGAQVAACTSTNREKAEAFGSQYGAKVFEDPAEMIAKRHIDVLYLVVPPFACDGRVERRAIAQGIPFLCEKPVGLNLTRCRAIAALIAERGLVSACGYLFRHGQAALAMKAVIARNEISVIRGCRMGGLIGPTWRRSMAKSGGAMVDLGTHTVDLMRWLFGDVKSVAALANFGICSKRFDGCDVYDSMDAQLLFGGGVIGGLALTSVMENGAKKSDLLDVYGKDFMLSFGWNSIRYKEGAADWVEVPVETDRLDFENRNFLEAVSKNDPGLVRSSYPDAVKTLAVTLAMNRSAVAGGKRIRLTA